MTQITIYQDRDGSYLGFACLGHAGFAGKGEDIVCAGISALTINTVNALGQLTDETFALETDEKLGRIELRLDKAGGHDAGLLIGAMVLGLQGILGDYGDSFLSLDYKEV